MGKNFLRNQRCGPLPSQVSAFNELRCLADLFFSNDWQDLVLKPRLYPLLIGPSGVGKTWIVQHIAATFRNSEPLPLLQMSYGGWIPTGVKVARGHALTRVYDFVAENETGLIHIDELDKFGSRDSDWNVIITQEIYALLDNRIHHSHDRIWHVDIQNKIRNRFLIVGSGTWQHLWQQRSQVGFLAADKDPSVRFIEHLASQKSIPEELLKRFNNRPILLCHLTKADMEEIIRSLEKSVDPDLLEGIYERIDEAVPPEKGFAGWKSFLQKNF